MNERLTYGAQLGQLGPLGGVEHGALVCAGGREWAQLQQSDAQH